MTRIMISVTEEEKNALCILAKNEFRDPRDQAALILRKELEGLGLIGSKSLSPEKNHSAGEVPASISV